MKRDTRKILILPLVTLALLASCSNTASSSSDETSSSSGTTETSSSKEDYYNSAWEPGAEAPANAVQPSVKNPQGELSDLNKMRVSQDNFGLPSKGEANILVVPVSIDQKNDFYSDSLLETINATFFKTGNDYPSVYQYYRDSSFKSLELTGVVSQEVHLEDSLSDLILYYNSNNKDALMQRIVNYVYNYLFVETETYYVGDFDSNDDRLVDNIAIVFNYSYDTSIDLGNDTMNSLYLSMFKPTVGFHSSFSSSDSPAVNSYISAAGNLALYNGKADSHVINNLIGQCIGLDDYSDLTGNSNNVYRSPLGYMDIEDGYVSDQNSFSKYQLGWIEPKAIKYSDIASQTMTIELEPAISSGDALTLYVGDKSKYGEYLIIDYYTIEGVNDYDSQTSSVYGTTLYSKPGIRVLKADSRLVRGYEGNYYEYYEEPDFTVKADLGNGKNVDYVYDYAYTNSWTNSYSSNGITGTYPLISFLSKDGINRHCVSSQTVSQADLFKKGDVFGSEDQIDGFYKDFAFDGNGVEGEKLGISFEVTDLTDEKATLTLRRTIA